MADNSARTPGAGESIRTIDRGTAKTEVAVLDGGGEAGPESLILGDAANGLDVDVTRVSGVVHVDDNAGSLTVDGTVAATQSGTWNIGSITGPVPVTDNAGSLTVDAPVGTPAFVRLSDGASPIATLPVSLASVPSHNVTNAGTFAVQADTELPAAAALADATANPTTPIVGAALEGWNGTTWDRLKSTTANGLVVDASRIQGNVTVVQGTGTNLHTVIDSGTVTTITNVVHVDDNAGSLTVDGTVAVSGTVTVDTELPAAAALADGAANPTTPSVGAALLGFNGTTFDRVRSRSLTNSKPLDVAIVDGSGNQLTSFGSGGVQYAEDSPHVSGDSGTMALAVQKSADAALGGDGDYEPLQVDATGWLKANIKASIAIPVTDNAGSLTVDNAGTFAVQADTELPAAAALADATANPTIPSVGADMLLYNGATWDRVRGDTTNGIDVDVTRVTGTVTVDTELPAAAALTDAFANPTTPNVAAMNMGWNGTTWDRLKSTTANGLVVDVSRVQGTVTVDTELPAAAAASDAFANPTAPGVLGMNMGWNGTTWDRLKSTTANGLVVDVSRVQGTVTVDTELTAVAALADATANPTITNIAALGLVYNGSTWDRQRGTTKGAFVQGDVAADAVSDANPLMDGGRASNAVPSAMSADGDAVQMWMDRSGSVMVQGTTRWGTTTALSFAAGLQSLATSTTVGQICTEIDLSATYFTDVLVLPYAQGTTAGSPSGTVDVYILGSLDGTRYSGDTSYSGTNGSYTLGAAGSMNMPWGCSIKMHANTAQYNGKPISLRALFGYLPPFFAVMFLNNCGIALHTSGNGADYRGVNGM